MDEKMRHFLLIKQAKFSLKMNDFIEKLEKLSAQVINDVIKFFRRIIFTINNYTTED